MRTVQLALVVMLLLTLSACSAFGKRGSGSPEDYGDGNIPIAREGSELGDVHFAFDSAALTEQGKAELKENATWLADNPGQQVVVEGHCDERGTAEYNLALGERRARSVYDFLRGLGVKSERMSTISYGEELPLDPGHGEEAWQKNRRAHFAMREN